MGGAGSHVPLLPSLPAKIRKAAITQALGRKFDKRKRLSRTLKRIIHYNTKHPNKDQCKLFRELVSNWTTVELSRLVEIYESTFTLQQVAAEAASARFLTRDAAADLLSVLEKQSCTDVVIRYNGLCYSCHKAILAVRSDYFKQLFAQMEVGSECVDMTSSSPANIDPAVFRHFLQYLYSGVLPNNELISVEALDALCLKFAVNNSVNQTLRHLHDSSEFCDVNLVFLRTSQSSAPLTDPVRLAEYACHSAVLASRSELLSNLIRRRRIGSVNSSGSTEIVLDDSVVSHKYAPLLLKIIYQDELDLSLVNSQANAATSSSLCEAQAIVAGRSNVTLLEETMELHHIGNFLELPALIEKCEDYIVRYISPENLSTILTWSQESSGSRWVYREALQYIQDNFMQICQCPALFSLDESTLAKVLQSDFLQATEFDVLKAIIHWSEHQLIRRLERREPNLVTNTEHSLAKKGIKAKDLDDAALREIASPLMLHLRQSHLLSSNPDVITCAVRRGLIGGRGVAPHRDMAASEPLLNQLPNHRQLSAWLPSNKSSSGRYDIPRAYMPFYDIARTLLEERTKDMSESDVVHLRRPNNPAPNTLNRSRMLRHSTVQNMTRIQEELSQLTFAQKEVEEVIGRTQQLLQTSIVVQALQACWDKSAVLKQVCLWAVRELGYADQIIYTINNRSQPSAQSGETPPTDFLSSSLVPDLAPERLILQHGLSTSQENLTIHSVNSSPDITLLSVRTYRKEMGAAPFPDVTLHSHSSSENENNSLRGANAKSRNRLVSSLQRVRKRSTIVSSATQSLPRRKPDLPEIMKQHSISDRPDQTDSSLPPDVLEHSPPTSETDLMPSRQSHDIRHAATLDSRPHRSHNRTQATNPYHTPPRVSANHRSIRSNSDTSPHHNLLYSSLTRNMNIDYNHIIASVGPPPDIAPQPPRRMTGTSTPPDITSSPNNTWQAML